MGGQALLCVQLQYFFSSYKLSTTVTVTMFLLFGHVTLLSLTFSLLWCVRDLCSYQVVWSTHPRDESPAYPFTLVWFANAAQERNFTPHRLQDIHTEVEADNWRRIPASKQQCEWGWRGPCRSISMSRTGKFLRRWWYYGDNIKGQFTSSFNRQPCLMMGWGEGS